VSVGAEIGFVVLRPGLEQRQCVDEIDPAAAAAPFRTALVQHRLAGTRGGIGKELRIDARLFRRQHVHIGDAAVAAPGGAQFDIAAYGFQFGPGEA